MVQSNTPEGVPLGFADLVEGLIVKYSAGIEIPVVQDEKFPSWVLEPVPEGEVTIEYRLRLDHDEYRWPVGMNEAAYTTDEMLFFTGQATFVHAPNMGEIEIEFEIPEGWTLSTP